MAADNPTARVTIRDDGDGAGNVLVREAMEASATQ